ncbi:MAG TPA: hypothetical protein VF397_14960 [Pyrinomonadaceae bacterium]
MSVLQRRVVSTLLALGLFGIVLLAVKIGSTQSVSNQKPDAVDPVVQAIRKGGLKEAARIKGHYEGTVQTTGWMKYDLEALASHSSTIVLGIPFSGSSDVVGGDSIETEYKVKVERVIKGKIKSGEFLDVAVPGGKVTFEDGTTAEIKAEDLGPIQENQRYIMFLGPIGPNPEVLRLTGGGQGLFEVDSDTRIKPRGHKTDIVQRHKDENLADFVNKIEIEVKKHPDTLPCCK